MMSVELHYGSILLHSKHHVGSILIQFRSFGAIKWKLVLIPGRLLIRDVLFLFCGMKTSVIFQEQNCYRLTITIYVHSVKLHAIDLRISFSLSPSPSPLPLACFKYTVMTTVMHSAIGSNPDNPDKVPAW